MMLSAKRPSQSDSFHRYRAGKPSNARPKRPTQQTTRHSGRRQNQRGKPASPPDGKSPTSSSVVTLSIGADQRLFAAHEPVLCKSPFFAARCRAQPARAPGSSGKRIALPDEQPETFSCVLEYLYRGDYYPRLVRNERRDTWELENGGGTAASQSQSQSSGNGNGNSEATIWHQAAGAVILRDTAVYCAAEKYALPSLKRLSLLKQGLRSGIQCSTILASARYAYAHTPDTESRLRAHYLALIIRCRDTFKRSGTMQMEMENGGTLFFDLFVALCNHMDDVGPSRRLDCR
ncbi:hypothetical protein PHISP_06477 [Aspergillus sp. HF37]|nr:hypothetical protein PHISP_06477 [Aspergillus sp. HF37]